MIKKDSEMKIVADRFIPFLEGVFEPYAEVVYKDGPDITREDCLDADVLITRTPPPSARTMSIFRGARSMGSRYITRPDAMPAA